MGFTTATTRTARDAIQPSAWERMIKQRAARHQQASPPDVDSPSNNVDGLPIDPLSDNTNNLNPGDGSERRESRGPEARAGQAIGDDDDSNLAAPSISRPKSSVPKKRGLCVQSDEENQDPEATGSGSRASKETTKSKKTGGRPRRQRRT